MKSSDIAAYARSELEPIPDITAGTAYRCAAHLKDGVYLPCVMLVRREDWVNLALRRFGESRPALRLFAGATSRNYRRVVETFVAAGNRVNDYDLRSLEPSPFALPLERLREIKGETSMSWTQFVATMRDGRRFSLGTTYSTEFFEMPPGYVAADIAGIEPHAKVDGPVYRERPFFRCFVTEL
jgi:hypothetical protein